MAEGKIKSIEKTQKAPESSSLTRAFARQPGIGISPREFDVALVPQMVGNLTIQRMFRKSIEQTASEPLDPETRSRMEGLLGANLSAVRLHTGTQAAESARGFGADAYTFGQDVVFAAGKYAPGTSEGRSLLAHELAHTVQQRQAGARGLSPAGARIAVLPESSLLEKEAAHAARQEGSVSSAVLSGPTTTPALVIARQSATQPPFAASLPLAPKPTSIPAIGGEWPEDAGVVYSTLEQMLIDRSAEGVREYVRQYVEDAQTATYNVQDTAGASEERSKAKADADRRKRTADLLKEQITKLSDRIETLRTHMKSDVEGVAFKRLTDNETYVSGEMSRFGFFLVGLPDFDPTKASGPEKTPKLQETKRLAQLLLQLDRTKREMKRAIVDIDGGRFDPDVPPPEQKVIRFGESSHWEYLKSDWDAASNLMARILNSNAGLFAAWSRSKLEDLASGDPVKDQGQMLVTIYNLLDTLLRNIKKARFNLYGGFCDYRDLKPIHDQMRAGLAVASETNWSEPLPKWVIQDEVKARADVEAFIKLGLETAAMIIAIAASLATGGAAALLIGAAASVGVAGAELVMAENKYSALKVAAASQVRPGENLVERGQVAEAEAQVEAQRINLAVTAIVAIGSHYAAGPVSGAVSKTLLGAAGPEAASVTRKAAISVISATAIGGGGAAFATAVSLFPKVSNGEMTQADYLAAIGWSSIESGLISAGTAVVTSGAQAALAARKAAKAPGAAPESSTGLAKRPPDAVVIMEPPPPAGKGPTPTLPGGTGRGGSIWQRGGVRFDAETGVVRFTATHADTGEQFIVEFNTLTGNGSIVHPRSGAIMIIEGTAGQAVSMGIPPGVKGLLPTGPRRAYLTVDQLLTPNRKGFNDPEVAADYAKYVASKKAKGAKPEPPEIWIRRTRYGPRERLEKILGPGYEFSKSPGEDRRVNVNAVGQPPAYTQARMNWDLALVLADEGKLWSGLARLKAEGVVGGEIGQRDWNKLRGNIAEILAESIKSRELAAIQAGDVAAGVKGSPAKIVRAVRARLPGAKGMVEFSDDLIVSERGGNLQIRRLFEVKAGPRGGQEATSQIHKWIEGHLEDGFEITVEIDGVKKTYVYAPEVSGKGRAVALARAPRVMITAAGAEQLGAGGAKQVAAPTVREALTQTPEEIDYLARAILSTLPQSPAPKP